MQARLSLLGRMVSRTIKLWPPDHFTLLTAFGHLDDLTLDDLTPDEIDYMIGSSRMER